MKPAPPRTNERDLCTIAELARRTGMTEAAIRGRIVYGHFREGTHFFRKGRRIMMDPVACNMFWIKE